MELYKNDEEEDEFRVYIIHGQSEDWRTVEEFINGELEMDTIVLKEEHRSGETIIEKFEELIEECDCAVAVLTQEDFKNTDGNFLASQKVLFELGYCHSFFESDYIILKERSIELDPSLDGLVYIEFDKGNIASTFPQLAAGLEDIFDSIGEEVDE